MDRQKLRLKIASVVFNLFPGKYCWADCVTWSFSKYRGWNPFKIDSAKGCEIESLGTNTCYCGDWHNGQCWEKLPKKERERILAERQAAYEKEKNDPPF